jgi:hypothetical protein
MSSDSYNQNPNSQQNGNSEFAAGDNAPTPQVKPVVLDKVQLQEYQENVFSVISQNNGRMNFNDLLALMGGAGYKQALYKVLMILAKQGRITRIRGLGKKRIEFYYYDTTKIKKPPPSAAVSFVQR